MKVASLAFALAVILATSQTAFAADEFIWTDRWNQMGREFQTGFAVGIADGLHVLGPWFIIGHRSRAFH